MERRRKRERKKETMVMILWRKQTRIVVVYLKYTSNYGLNTRIAPDKQFYVTSLLLPPPEPGMVRLALVILVS